MCQYSHTVERKYTVTLVCFWDVCLGIAKHLEAGTNIASIFLDHYIRDPHLFNHT